LRKSTILRAFKKQLEAGSENRPPKRVFVTAPTNLAAFAVGGRTTFNYAGWSISSLGDSLETLKEAAHMKKAWARFVQTDVLVIDEISMVESNFFERLNIVLKEARGNDKAFGGVQIVVTGDVS
jgi:ATP-dependent DNA helicase PIF1